MEATNELIKRIENEINKTPTGELRNLLCDANVLIQYQLLKEKSYIDQLKELKTISNSISSFLRSNNM